MLRRIFLRRKDKTGLPLIPNGLRFFLNGIPAFLVVTASI